MRVLRLAPVPWGSRYDTTRPRRHHRPRPRWTAALPLVAVVAIAAGCALPTPPSYPNYGAYLTRDNALSGARTLSTNLENYVKDWMAGKVSATIPANLIPSGAPKGVTGYTLQRPDQVDPAQQWLQRPAGPINRNKVVGLFPDPHATYLVMPHFFAPFGSKAVMTGQFPRARFFDVQVSPPFDPDHYYFGEAVGLGSAEVPILDADIDPDPGSVNPYRVNADRNAANRSYTVTLHSAAGNAADLNPAMRLPYYRGAGNARIGGGIEFVGPWGCSSAVNIPAGGGRGCLSTGEIWVRYYGPDQGAGPLGGVPLPKLLYQLPDGRQYFIKADISGLVTTANAAAPIPASAPAAPTAAMGPNAGWLKEQGVPRTVMYGIAPVLGKSQADLPSYVRDYDKGVNSHGEDVAAPGNDQHGATEALYIDYMTRRMALPAGMVMVVTGRLPSTPATRQGQTTMTAAQARYWSLTQYSEGLATSGSTTFAGQPINSLMDDEIVRNGSNQYVMAFSRAGDRPSNATPANGVTWADWGPAGTTSFTLRWLSAGPEWTFCKAPDQNHLGWRADPASKVYDPKVLGQNDNQTAFLGDYQPVVHLMSRAQFEALGNKALNPTSIPTWVDINAWFQGPPTKVGPTGC